MRIFIKRLLRNSFFQVFSGIVIVMVIGGWGIGKLEGVADITQGINPFWWAIVTMTTVGYGDFYPESAAGRLFAVIIMFGGISLTALLTATISSIFVARRIREDKGLEKVTVTDHMLICGWNKNVHPILDSIQTLSEGRKLEVVLINEANEDEIDAIRNKYREIKFKYVRGDFTRETILEQANLKDASTAIILPNDIVESGGHPDEKTIFGTLTIKTLAPHVRVVAYLTERENLTHIKRANADEVLLSDDFGAFMLAAHVMNPGVPQTVDRLLNSKSDSRFRRIAIPTEYVGRSFSDLFDYFRSKKGMIMVSVFSEEEQIGIGEILSSDSSNLDAFIERKLKEAGHSLQEESKMAVMINPQDEYIIKENEKAVVIQ
ncbi:MAG: ion channel [Candidatus Marinimicrobia bacterium]|jgi:voltage-gated potassium channel|nr:ion channel [Candidatus Neomarinimicrobiota bacterium]MDP7653423.1 ion channel [Candidatus Neomarinimicrobiota bacterium]|tara:strand:- start:260 stop:1387 length:1128 start_codon:yes stop_codon:yes gene_type:complete